MNKGDRIQYENNNSKHDGKYGVYLGEWEGKLHVRFDDGTLYAISHPEHILQIDKGVKELDPYGEESWTIESPKKEKQIRRPVVLPRSSDPDLDYLNSLLRKNNESKLNNLKSFKDYTRNIPFPL